MSLFGEIAPQHSECDLRHELSVSVIRKLRRAHRPSLYHDVRPLLRRILFRFVVEALWCLCKNCRTGALSSSDCCSRRKHMTVSRNALAAAAIGGLGAVLATLSLGASAQTPPAERIVGYSVYAHSQYVLLQRPDGRLRTCSMQRQTPLRPNPEWNCTVLEPVP